MIFNLGDEQNDQPVVALLSGKVTPEALVSMDARDLASTELQTKREEATMAHMWNKRTDWAQEVVNSNPDYKGMFKCEDCGSQRTGFIQVQIERADEPMTNFVYCYDCRHRY